MRAGSPAGARPDITGKQPWLIVLVRTRVPITSVELSAEKHLLKDSPAEQLANAIRRVHAGGRAVDPELAAEAWSEPDPLTDRERQVLRRAGEGQATGEIAEALHLSEGTVRNYLSEAISKLGAQNRVEAARIAREKGWL